MNKRKVFLRWLLLLAFIGNSIIIAVVLGFHETLFSTSIGSVIGSIIFTLFVAVSLRLGMDSFTLSSIVKNEEPDHPHVMRLRNHTTIGNFVGGVCMAVGMVGTILGIRTLLTGFDTVEAGNHESVKALMETVASGFGTALDTTLIGLMCSILLSVQCFNILYETRPA